MNSHYYTDSKEGENGCTKRYPSPISPERFISKKKLKMIRNPIPLSLDSVTHVPSSQDLSPLHNPEDCLHEEKDCKDKLCRSFKNMKIEPRCASCGHIALPTRKQRNVKQQFMHLVAYMPSITGI